MQEKFLPDLRGVEEGGVVGGAGEGGGRGRGGGGFGKKRVFSQKNPMPCAKPPMVHEYTRCGAWPSTEKLPGYPPYPPPAFEKGRFSPPETYPTRRQGRRTLNPKPQTLNPKP